MNKQKKMSKIVIITESHSGQRVDNFLFTSLKGIPKSRIYRSLRQGEVRINKKRVKPDYRLQEGDSVRLPPLRTGEPKPLTKPSPWQTQIIEKSIIYEDEGLLIINKPSGIATHGGSGISFGAIEILRYLRPEARFLELAHRLDRDTSGCLVIAKKRSILQELHQLLREQRMEKIYLTLVLGKWRGEEREVNLPLLKHQLISGERMVRVSEQGQSASTIFQCLERFGRSSLLKVTLHTGRTHQIRVHATHIGHPVAGDEKYGDKKFNKDIRETGLKRLFLHAASLTFYLPSTKQTIAVCACLDPELLNCLENLRKVKF